MICHNENCLIFQVTQEFVFQYQTDWSEVFVIDWSINSMGYRILIKPITFTIGVDCLKE